MKFIQSLFFVGALAQESEISGRKSIVKNKNI